MFKRQTAAYWVIGSSLSKPLLHRQLSLLIVGPLVCNLLLLFHTTHTHTCTGTHTRTRTCQARCELHPGLYSSTVLLLSRTSDQMLKAGQPSHNPGVCHSSPPHLLSIFRTVKSNMPGGMCKLSSTYLSPVASRLSPILLQSSKEHEIWGLTAWIHITSMINKLCKYE